MIICCPPISSPCKKYLKINNLIDKNVRFACLPNVMSPSQTEVYGLALSRASKNIEPY